jgi:hypothetical protein
MTSRFPRRYRRLLHRSLFFRPAMPVKKLMRYRTPDKSEIYTAATHWGSDCKYCSFYRDLHNMEHRFLDPTLPPRETLREAQADLDRYAEQHSLEKIE